MYARGMTVREMQAFLAEQYSVDVSPELISSVTDAVMAEVGAWQARPLEPMYPVVFFDALRVKIREDAVVRNKALYLALGVLPDGTRDIVGLWIEGTEGAKFWMKVFNDLKTCASTTSLSRSRTGSRACRRRSARVGVHQDAGTRAQCASHVQSDAGSSARLLRVAARAACVPVTKLARVDYPHPPWISLLAAWAGPS